MTDQERRIQEEIRQFVRDEVSPDMVRALDRDEIQYPREFLEKLAKYNLLGLRIDPRWGRREAEEAETEKIFSDEDPG